MGIKANEVVEFLFGFNSMAKSYFGFSFVLRPVLKARSVSAGTLPDYTLLHFFIFFLRFGKFIFCLRCKRNYLTAFSVVCIFFFHFCRLSFS